MNRIAIYSLALLVFVLDQIAKSKIAHTFIPGESRELLNNVFGLTYVQNTGGAFGILSHGTLWLAAAAIVAATAIVVYTMRVRHALSRTMAIALALPLGGAVGNLVDRVRLGYVIDFLDVHIGVHHWPIFNIADSAICVGVALLAIHFSSAPAQSAEPKEPNPQPLS